MYIHSNGRLWQIFLLITANTTYNTSTGVVVELSVSIRASDSGSWTESVSKAQTRYDVVPIELQPKSVYACCVNWRKVCLVCVWVRVRPYLAPSSNYHHAWDSVYHWKLVRELSPSIYTVARVSEYHHLLSSGSHQQINSLSLTNLHQLCRVLSLLCVLNHN